MSRRRHPWLTFVLGALAIAVGCWIAFRAPPPPPAAPDRGSGGRERFHVVDVHVHLAPDGVERLGRLMQRWQFDHVVNLSGGLPGRGLPEQLAAARASGGRVTVFTTLSFNDVRFPDYGARMAQSLRRAHAMGARGLKISKLLGLGLPAPDGRLLPVDDPGLDPVFEAAAELGLPVSIHSGDPRAFWLPIDEKNERKDELEAHPGWSQHGQEVPSFDQILEQLERRVARHPKTTFISVHFGNCAEDPERVAKWLRKYPNLYVDTAARVPELGRHPPEKMRAFFVEFQDRVLYGSDLGVSAEPEPLFLGSEGKEPAGAKDEERFFTATRRYFETTERDFDHPTPIQGKWRISGVGLPPEVLRKIYGDNARRLIKLDVK
ncbi:MAG: amidohydrolase family protein [Polyangiaceae bacterium]|nr:amidohydrolase family protein [Polyangiaceae bacterium]MCL4748934.1 amidohydrolase family protein [Myxococcales bacterium]